MSSFITSPVRHPTPSTWSVRGQVSSAKSVHSPQYESALERDLLHLLEFDDQVEFYCEQPITIEYEYGGVRRHYTPDVLVYYRQEMEMATPLRPLLVEVKYRADLKQHWTEWKPRFLAAARYADQQGWQFKLLTEREIRTDYLTNVHFLRHYTTAHDHIRQEDQALIMSLLRDIRQTTPQELLLMATADRGKRAELLYTLWHLVAVGLIHCDLTVTLSLQAEIWIP